VSYDDIILDERGGDSLESLSVSQVGLRVEAFSGGFPGLSWEDWRRV